MKEVSLFGIRIHALTMAQAVDAVAGFIKERTPRQGVFLNAGKYYEIDRNPSLKTAIEKADLRLADGQAVVWACGLLGKPLPERVTGIDLMERLMIEGGKRGWRFYFFGATEEVVRRTVAMCREQYGVTVAGYRNGYFTPEEEEAVARSIAAASADILFVAMSSPKKEMFMDRWLAVMNVPFSMGVGGSFDVVAGAAKRAPRWMRAIGMEWFYRMAQEPGRLWRRYLFGNLYFIRRTAACCLRVCDCCGKERP